MPEENLEKENLENKKIFSYAGGALPLISH